LPALCSRCATLTSSRSPPVKSLISQSKTFANTSPINHQVFTIVHLTSIEIPSIFALTYADPSIKWAFRQTTIAWSADNANASHSIQITLALNWDVSAESGTSGDRGTQIQRTAETQSGERPIKVWQRLYCIEVNLLRYRPVVSFVTMICNLTEETWWCVRRKGHLGVILSLIWFDDQCKRRQTKQKCVITAAQSEFMVHQLFPHVETTKIYRNIWKCQMLCELMRCYWDDHSSSAIN
jgi:hypothetical protein